MRRWIDWRSEVAILPTFISGANRGGLVQETNSGALIFATAHDGVPRLHRSNDGGATWSLRQTMDVARTGVVVKGAFVDSRGHIYMGAGTTDCLWSNYASNESGRIWRAELWKSSDDGITWRKVCTGEAGTFWHLGEDADGRIYVNEYSQLKTAGANGPTWPGDYGTIPDEYPAVNVWRSDAAGEVFAKWYSAPKPTGAGLRDGTRHIHAVYVDPADPAKRVYVAAGDYSGTDANLRWSGIAGKVVQLNASAAIALDYGQFGNGSTSFIGGGPGGTVLVGKDNNPSGLDAINPLVATSCQQCDLRQQFGTKFDGYVFDLFRSAEGVIFGNVTLSGRYPSILFSLNDGRTWGALDYGTAQGNTLTHNPNAPSGRMFMSGGSIQSIKVPSRVDLGWKRPFYAPRT